MTRLWLGSWQSHTFPRPVSGQALVGRLRTHNQWWALEVLGFLTIRRQLMRCPPLKGAASYLEQQGPASVLFMLYCDGKYHPEGVDNLRYGRGLSRLIVTRVSSGLSYYNL
jgi:hypothetical protein